MKSDIAYLEIVEKDLAELAAKAKARAAEGSGSLGLSGRGRMPVAAAVVALLVAAGGIGFLAQGGRNNSSPASGGAAVAAASPAARAALHQAGLSPQLPFYKGLVLPPGTQGSAYTSAVSAGGSGAGALASPPLGDTSLQGVGIGDLSKIERDGSISLQIPNGTFSTKMAEVIKVATANGGSVLSSTTAAEKSGTFTLRVPARSFENAMIALRPLGTVLSSQEVGQDVTAQYVDLKAHMRILFGRRAVILKLMSQATTISDTLVLQNQYDNTQLQIDQYQGQLNVIHNQVAESTITVSLAEKDSPSKVAATAVSTPSVGRSFHLGWQGFLRVIGAVVIGLGYLIPIAVLFAIAWTVRVLARRRRVASSAI
jgi:Domain of unknown function (DUF4349)